LTATVYLNGRFLPLEEACVPVLDRGFLLGDGVYEVIPVYGRRPFRLDQHLGRLAHSLAAVRIPDPLDRDSWRRVVEELVARNAGDDQSLYLQVTRGVASKRDHGFPEGIHPTVLLMSSVLHPPARETLEQGVAAVTAEDTRWARCDIKAITLLANVLLRQDAIDAGAAEAILVRDGEAVEGAASNLFIVEGGRLVTPPKGPRLLPGITRDLVLELAESHGLPAAEEPIALQRLRSADEIWLTSSTREIMPVIRLDGRAVGGGRAGETWRRMYGLYQEYKEHLRRGELREE